MLKNLRWSKKNKQIKRPLPDVVVCTPAQEPFLHLVTRVPDEQSMTGKGCHLKFIMLAILRMSFQAGRFKLSKKK